MFSVKILVVFFAFQLSITSFIPLSCFAKSQYFSLALKNIEVNFIFLARFLLSLHNEQHLGCFEDLCE